MAESDKPKLKPANENPWYCLATLYGEQRCRHFWQADAALSDKNREAWNAWFSQVLTAEHKATSRQKGFTEADVVPLTDAKLVEFREAFAARTGDRGAIPPGPGNYIYFESVNFDVFVSFVGFYFRDVSFCNSKFSADADFSSAKFFSGANFEFLTFLSAAYFRESVFFADTYFTSSEFLLNSEFISSKFSGIVDFTSAKFSTEVDFRSSEFSAHARFRSSTFSTDVDFRSSKFSAHADFINAKFEGRTHFAQTTFVKCVPDFRGGSLHEATEWHGAIWPPPPSDEEAAQAQVYTYQRLKQEMERLKKHDDELFFFRKELRAKRAVARVLSPEWLLNALYDVTSSYGQSIGKPLLWLFELSVFGMIFFMEVPALHGAPLPWPDAARLSVANIFSVLGLKKEFFDQADIIQFSGLVKIFSAAEAIAGAILLFLLGLALRNRFRIK